MIRLLITLMLLCLLPLSSLAEFPLTFSEDLTGEYCWPEAASAEAASYVYRYAYPQIAGDSELALNINTVFNYEVTDALGFECPMIGSSHPAEEGQMQVDLAYDITQQNDKSLSVRIDKTVTVGEQISRIVKGYTFALTGEKAGMVTSLPYLLGLLKDNETDEWYIERQTAKADACARELVWALIEKDMKQEGSLIYPDITFEEFEWGFYPEEDFFLNDDGDLVFFLQEGVIAPAEAGQFFYTVSMDDMLDEI